MSESDISGFVVFCLEAYKKQEGISGAKAMDMFSEYGVLDYLTEGYAVLHSLGENALTEDISDYISRRHATHAS